MTSDPQQQQQELPTHQAGFKPPADADAGAVASAFVAAFGAAAASNDGGAFAALFTPTGYWRDILAFTRDFRTFAAENKGQIATAAKDTFPGAKASGFAVSPEPAPVLESPFPDVSWVRAHFDFKTALGTASGVARLVFDAQSRQWKAYTVYTLLEEIDGHPQRVGAKRVEGEQNLQETYDQRRARESEFKDKDPKVLILGAGHNGLATAAMLNSFGVTSLCIDKFERIGDNWRKRYASLSLHDPVYTNHMPFMPFPDNWPKFMPAGKLANWLESYAEAMECNVWLKSTLDPARTKWDAAAEKWNVVVLRTRADGSVEERPMSVGHIVLATGLAGGKAKMPPPFKGQEQWGGTIVHSSKHKGGDAWRGKKALVVGACTSAHDISADLVNKGVATTMLQRSPTFIMSIKNGLPLLEEGLAAHTIDQADRMMDSVPKQVGRYFHQRIVRHLAEADKDILDGLKKVGFRTWPGIEGTGWLLLALHKVGGYYFTAGGSEMIAEGKIGVKPGEIASFDADKYVTFTDGSRESTTWSSSRRGTLAFPRPSPRRLARTTRRRSSRCGGSTRTGRCAASRATWACRMCLVSLATL
ncbi:hypothetical protein VHUM_02899 [Vanrija humicola]|uniref:FAD/NAD(P)-binding domain-containing protein n=1 Tax=Vanrija humicola TaxID=5417 RepID=A0A7D8V4G4_VANHU|nr:hypothetical protein VHUM_02899 [Vanrija humicola]